MSSPHSYPVSNLLTSHYLPHPTIPSHNLSPPQLPPPPTTTLTAHHHHHHHLHHSRHIVPPPPTTSQIPSFSSVLPTQTTLPRPLYTPIPALNAHPQYISSNDHHPPPELPHRPTKLRRLDTTTAPISTLPHIQQPPTSTPPTPVLSSRPLSTSTYINNHYETVTPSPRSDGYSTGSRETAPVPDTPEDDHDIETPYTCAHCAARFPDREQRKQHIKTAHEKPFVCTVCKTRFTRKFDLEKHSLTVHEGMRPFQCDICNLCFGQKHHLLRHKKAVHHKARDFACDSCSSRFARKEHLGNHKRAVHEKHKPYMCSLCDVQYYERRALRRHLEQVHSVKSTRASVFVEWQPNGTGSAPSIQELVQM